MTPVNSSHKNKKTKVKTTSCGASKNASDDASSTVPFATAQDAWFWFIAAQEARNGGARFSAGQGLYPRPCEPIDILKVLDRLYRNRRLLRDHLLVLRHYGRRHMAPDPYRAKEQRAARLWHEAMERIAAVLEKKGIIEAQKHPHENWHMEALLYESASQNDGARI